MSIRQATIADAQSIAELHVRAWQWAYKGLLPDAYLAGLSLTLDRRKEGECSYRKELGGTNGTGE